MIGNKMGIFTALHEQKQGLIIFVLGLYTTEMCMLYLAKFTAGKKSEGRLLLLFLRKLLEELRKSCTNVFRQNGSKKCTLF